MYRLTQTEQYTPSIQLLSSDNRLPTIDYRRRITKHLENELAPQRRIAADLGATFGSRIFAMLLALLGNIASARGLGPVDFGRFGLVMAVITICGTLADMGLTYTAIKFIAQYLEEKREQAILAARVYLGLRLVTGGASTVLLFVLAEPLAIFVLGQPDLTPYLQIGSMTTIALAISSYPSTVLVGLGEFGKLGVASVLNAVITAGSIGLLFAGGALNLSGLVILNVGLPLISTLPMWLMLPGRWVPWRGVAGSRLEMARSMFGFSKWIFFSNLGSIVVAQGDLLLLGRLADPVTVGVYSVALTLAMRLDVLNQSLFTVMMPRASRLSGQAAMRTYLRRVLAGSLALAAALAVVALLAQPVIGLLYGERYTAAAPLFMALLVVVLFDLVTSSLFLIAFPLDKPRILAFADWLRVLVLGLTGWLLIPIYGGFGAVLARLFARVSGTTVALSALRRALERDTK